MRVTTRDLGDVGIDNIFGSGLVDVQSAHDWLTEHPPSAEPTPVASPTPAPLTPTPTPTAPGGGTPASSLYFSIADRGPRTIGGVPGVNDEDVVVVTNGETRLFFDGSDVGLTQVDVDAFAIADAATLLLSFDRPTVVDGLAVDDSDIVAFHATSLGDETAGFFSLYMIGSAEGLYTNGADIDAIDLLDDGRLLISLRGRTQLPGLAEAADGDDVLIFNPAALRKTSSVAWAFALRGSELGLKGLQEENLDGIVMVDSDTLQMSFDDSSAIPGLVAGGSDVLECTLSGTGSLQSCLRSTLFTPEMLQVGFLATNIDAIEVGR